MSDIKINLEDRGWEGVDGTYWFHKIPKDLLASQKKSDPLI